MKINNKHELETAIIELEKRKLDQEKIMIAQFHTAKESLSPVNILKNTFSKITHDTDIKSKILRTAAGLGIGILTKKIFTGNSTSIVKKVLGNAMEVGVVNSAINHTDKIKAYGIAIYNNIFKKQHSQNGHMQ